MNKAQSIGIPPARRIDAPPPRAVSPAGPACHAARGDGPRAVYTDVSAEDLTEFLSAYDLGPLLSFKGIAEGVENSNFLIETGRGRFILTLYEKRVKPEELPFFLGLMGHLADRGISCPLPVRAHDGQALRTLAGRPAAIVTFLEGVSYRRPSPVHCGQLGGALAALHAAGQGFGMKRANALSVSGWRPLAEAAGEGAERVAPAT